MALFGEVKCGRCDRRYSALRSRCPYCGAGRGRSAKKNATVNGGTGQLIAGAILLVAIIAAVVVLIVMSMKLDKDTTKDKDDSGISQIDDSGVSTVEGENTDVVPEGTTPTTPSTPTEPTEPEGGSTPTEPTEPEGESTPTEPTDPETIILSVSLNYSDVSLFYIGEPVQMKATVLPVDAEVPVTWSTSDPAIASVDENGLVAAVNRGDATITATAGDKTATCVVRVRADAPEGSTAVTTGGTTLQLSHTDVSISSSSHESFTLSVKGATGTPSFYSSNSSVASVDSSGIVTAQSAGTATVTVSVDGANFECIVRVS